MKTPRLKQLLSVRSVDLGVDHYQALQLTFGATTTLRDLLLAFIEDYRADVYSAYRCPRLMTGIQRCHGSDIQFLAFVQSIDLSEENLLRDSSLTRLEDMVRRNRLVPASFRIGENWRKQIKRPPGEEVRIEDDSFDVIAHFHLRDDTQVLLTPRTTTGHLSPFIDAKVMNATITVWENENEVLRESLRDRK